MKSYNKFLNTEKRSEERKVSHNVFKIKPNPEGKKIKIVVSEKSKSGKGCFCIKDEYAPEVGDVIELDEPYVVKWVIEESGFMYQFGLCLN